jgi:hypothetical protein
MLTWRWIPRNQLSTKQIFPCKRISNRHSPMLPLDYIIGCSSSARSHRQQPRERIRPCDLQKLNNSLKLWKSCGIDDISNECLRHFPRRPLVHSTHLFNHGLRLSHFPKSWKEAKVITLSKPRKNRKVPHNFRPISLLSTRGKLLQKVMMNIIPKTD